MNAILFKQRYDTARLMADLEAATAAASWIAKPEKDIHFKWSAIPLHSLRGEQGLDAVDWHVKGELAGDCAPTPFMECCPYVRSLLEALPASKLRVRFMKLEAGGHIGRHRDRLYGWELPILRLHVPITTHAGVEFLVEEQRIGMSPGELWYVNTSKDHELANRGPTDRVHLVIDLVNSPHLREQLGPDTWERVLS
jgi:hypothetical protein